MRILALRFCILVQTLFVLYRCQHGIYKSEGDGNSACIELHPRSLFIGMNQPYPITQEQTPLHLPFTLQKTSVHEDAIALGKLTYRNLTGYNEVIMSSCL